MFYNFQHSRTLHLSVPRHAVFSISMADSTHPTQATTTRTHSHTLPAGTPLLTRDTRCPHSPPAARRARRQHAPTGHAAARSVSPCPLHDISTLPPLCVKTCNPPRRGAARAPPVLPRARWAWPRACAAASDRAVARSVSRLRHVGATLRPAEGCSHPAHGWAHAASASAATASRAMRPGVKGSPHMPSPASPP